MSYQELFNHMHNEHDLILLESEMQEIISIINKMQDSERFKEGGNTIISTKDYLKLKKIYSKMQLLLIEIQTAIDYEEIDKDNQSYFMQKLNILIKESTEL